MRPRNALFAPVFPVICFLALAAALPPPLSARAEGGANGGRGGATGIRRIMRQSPESGCTIETRLIEMDRLGEDRLSPEFSRFREPLLRPEEAAVLAKATSCDAQGRVTLARTRELYSLVYGKKWLESEAVKTAFELAMKRITEVVPSFSLGRNRREFTGTLPAPQIYVEVSEQYNGPYAKDFGPLELLPGQQAAQLLVRSRHFYQVMVPDYLSARVLDAAAAWIHDLIYTDSNDENALNTQRVVEYVFSRAYDEDTPEARRQKFSGLGFHFRLAKAAGDLSAEFRNAVLLELESEKLARADEQLGQLCNAAGFVSCPGYLEAGAKNCPKVTAYSNGVLTLEEKLTKVSKFFGPLESVKKFNHHLSGKERAWYEANQARLVQGYLGETLHRSYFPDASLVERVCFKHGRSGGLTQLLTEIVENAYVADSLDSSLSRDLARDEEREEKSWKTRLRWEGCMKSVAGLDRYSLEYDLHRNICDSERSSDDFVAAMVRINLDAASVSFGSPLRSDRIVRRVLLLRTK
jgi:hypothetical protein